MSSNDEARQQKIKRKAERFARKAEELNQLAASLQQKSSQKQQLQPPQQQQPQPQQQQPYPQQPYYQQHPQQPYPYTQQQPYPHAYQQHPQQPYSEPYPQGYQQQPYPYTQQQQQYYQQAYQQPQYQQTQQHQQPQYQQTQQQPYSLAYQYYQQYSPPTPAHETFPPQTPIDAQTIQKLGDLSAWIQEAVPYDEIRTPSGQYRPAYQKVVPIIEQIKQANPARIENFATESLKDFKGDNKLHHIPRMLTQDERNLLGRGVEQRARALQAFIQDHYSGKQSYMQQNIIPFNTLQSILLRSKETAMLKQSSIFNNWGFWYGPDIIRGADGQFYVCEDNIGYVGGMGDLHCARKSITKHFPEIKPCLAGPNPNEFYDQISNQYKVLAGGNAVVLLHYPNNWAADNEEKRVIRLFDRRNITHVILPRSKKKNAKKGLQLKVIKNDGVYLVDNRITNKQQRNQQRVRVGLVIIDAEPFDVDPRNSTVKKKIINDEALSWLDYFKEKMEEFANDPVKKNKFEKKYNQLRGLLDNNRNVAPFLRKHHRSELRESLQQGVPRLLDAYYEHQVKIINGPGFDFIGDKLFCTFTDALIRYYFPNEEIILQTIPTKSFAIETSGPNKIKAQGDRKAQKQKIHSVFQLDQNLLSQVFDLDPRVQNYVVIKRVDGRGGDAVWVGPKISREVFMSVKPLIAQEPEAFIVQKYTALSQVDGNIVDLRNLAHVGNDGIIVSSTLWGRGVPVAGGNGKVNISDKGFEFTVCTAK